MESSLRGSLFLGSFKDILSIGKCQKLFCTDIVTSRVVQYKFTTEKDVTQTVFAISTLLFVIPKNVLLRESDMSLKMAHIKGMFVQGITVQFDTFPLIFTSVGPVTTISQRRSCASTAVIANWRLR